MYKQLDIYWVDLEPTRGSETQKKKTLCYFTI
jgi:hypothetical protein